MLVHVGVLPEFLACSFLVVTNQVVDLVEEDEHSLVGAGVAKVEMTERALALATAVRS